MVIADRIAILNDGRRISDLPGWRRVSGDVAVDEKVHFPADFLVFRTPRSYTRQDMVEVHTIGAPPVLEIVRKRIVQLGARQAEPGEFTARAFLNGAMDLASAEAVAGIIRARSDHQLRAFRHLLGGALSITISAARDELAELLALVEADIDFAEEPIEFITPPELQRRMQALESSLGTLIDCSAPRERVEVLPNVLLLGPPNAGKSTLMNRLSGTSRAICAAVAGTTRDILSATMPLGDGEAVLLDSAGVDHAQDEVFAHARELTLNAAERVDCVCIVLDAREVLQSSGYLGDFYEQVRRSELPPVVVALNKCDVLHADEVGRALEMLAERQQGDAHAVSAQEGLGIDPLRTALKRAIGLGEESVSAQTIPLTHRQCAAMEEAIAALQRAAALTTQSVETIDCADVLAFELREALDALGRVTGQVGVDELLSHVFANFCIGK